MVFAFKTSLVLILLFIIFNLAKALFYMVRSTSSKYHQHSSMSRFLGRRLLFSIAVVLLLIAALSSGLLEPNPRPY